MTRIIVLALGLLTPLIAVAQAAGPDPAALDDAVRLGKVATLAPICGLRPNGWAADLRRATILGATHTDRPDDPALRAAPGSQLVIGALSFAESEALESFAGAPQSQTCETVSLDPDLIRADRMVQSFRDLRHQTKPSS